VLSLARDGKLYAVPISYGYDAGKRLFSLRLVVYEEDDPVYSSVVATGSLDEISRDELTVEHVEQYGEAERPLFGIWGNSLPDLNVRLYQLDPDELSGRRAEIEQADEPS